MKYSNSEINNIKVQSSSFIANDSEEVHVVFTPSKSLNSPTLKSDVLEALKNFCTENDINPLDLVFTRFFVSDYANQPLLHSQIKSEVEANHGATSISIVQQPSTEGCKLILWAYFIKGINPEEKLNVNNYETVVNKNDYKHIYSTNLIAEKLDGSSHKQTDEIFLNYQNL